MSEFGESFRGLVEVFRAYPIETSIIVFLFCLAVVIFLFVLV